MPLNSRDFQGRRIQDTYNRVVQWYGPPTNSLYDGRGTKITPETASYALTASYASFQMDNEWSSSWASQSLSASHALRADHADSCSYAHFALSSSHLDTSDAITVRSGSDSWRIQGLDGALQVTTSLGGEWGFGYTGEFYSREGFMAYPTAGGGYLDYYIPKNTAAVWDGIGRLTSSLTSDTQIGYVSGSRSNIQDQIDGKESQLVTGSTYQITSSWAVSSSWSSQSLSSSYADFAESSSYSLTTDGIIVQTATRNVDSVTITNTYTAWPIKSAVTVGEASPHVSGRNCKSGSALFGGGWGSTIYRINNPDVDLQDITSASCILSPRNISAGVYSATTNAVYYIVGGAWPSLPSTASIIKVDALTLSQSLFYDGIDNGSGGYGLGLPPIVADDNYLYVPTAADASCQILKIDILSGSLIDSKIWNGAGGSHAAQMSDDKTFFIATTGGGSICRVNTADFSVISSSLSLGYITDDIAILNGYAYPVREAGFMTQFYKVDVNTLSSSIISATEHSYGSFTDGVNLYIGNFDANQMWVYPNGDLNAGPYVFNVVGQPNEMWFTNGGNIVATSWNTSNIYLYSFPYKFVGIDKTPSTDTVLDVGGSIIADGSIQSGGNLYGVNIVSGSYGNFKTQTNTNVLRFSSSIISAYTGSVQITAAGNLRMTNVTASIGIRTPFISASVINASGSVTSSIGFVGTASWAESASWSSGSFSSSYSDFAQSSSWGQFAPSSSYADFAKSSSYGDFAKSASWSQFASASYYSLSASYEINYETSGSWADFAKSSSWGQFAPSSSYADFAKSSSWGQFAPSSSYADFAKSASWAGFASTATSTVGTASYATFAQSSSWGQFAPSSSYGDFAKSSSYALNTNLNVTVSYANFAKSSSWGQFAPSSSFTDFAKSSSYADFAESASWTDVAVSSSYVLTVDGGVRIESNSVGISGSLVTPFYGYDSGLKIGTMEIQSKDNNNGWICNNAYSNDSGTSWIRRLNGPAGVIHFSSPEMDIRMASSDVAGTTLPTAAQLKIEGTTDSVYLGGAFNPNTFTPVGWIMAITGSGRVVVSGSVAVRDGITGSLLGTASYADFAKSASWAPLADTASWAVNAQTASVLQGTASYADFAKSSSWGQFAPSASHAEWATTASYALNAGTGPGATGVTQSWFDMDVKSMVMSDSGGYTGQVQETAIVYKYAQPALLNFYYLKFPSRDGGGVADHGYGTHVFKVPFNYSGALTHSFSYIDTGDQALGGNGELSGSTKANTAYWEVRLYAITSSNSPKANIWENVSLVETKVITQSLTDGDPVSSGSVWSTSSYFNDAGNKITNNTTLIMNLIRVSTTEVGSAGDGTDYSASLGLISSQYRWISS